MLKVIAPLLCFTFIVSSLKAQNTVASITVEPNNVSGGGFQSDVTISDDGKTIYSSADVAGIFKSTDGGLLYKTFTKGLKSPKVASLVITPDNDQILYAGTGDKGGSGGLFRSIDGGNNWTLTDAGDSVQFAGNHSADADPVPNGHPRSNGDLLVVDEGNNSGTFTDDIIIAGTYNTGVRILTNGGNTEADAVVTSGFVRSVARDNAIPNRAYAAIYLDEDSPLNGIYEIDYTNPTSASSTLVYATFRPEGLTVLSNGHIYAAIGDGGIVKYDGNTWSLINTGLDTGNELRQWTAVTGYVSGANDIVYAGLNNLGGNANGSKYSSIWRTENGGNNWTPLVDVDQNIDHTIYGQTYDWWFSTDAFPPATLGERNSVVSSIDVARGALTNNVSDDIIYVSGRGGIWKSDNGGALWNPAVYNMPATANEGVAVNPNKPSQVVIANTDFVVLETNSAFTGTDISRDKPTGSDSRAYDAIFDAKDNQFILGVGDRDKNDPGGGEVYIKATAALGNPSGNGWTNTNLQGATLSNNGRVRAVSYGHHDGTSETTQIILAAVEGEGVFRYYNGNWTKSNGPTIGSTQRTNFVWPNNTNSGVVYMLDLDQGLYRSNDGGQNWTDIWPDMDFRNNDFFNTGYITADDSNPTTIYVSIQGRSGSPIGTNFKVYRMTDADTGIFGAPGTAGITDITKHSGNSTIRRPGPIVFGHDGRLWLTQQQNSTNGVFAGLFVMENPTTDTYFKDVTTQEYQNIAFKPSKIAVSSDGIIYLSQNAGFVKISIQEEGGTVNTAPVANAGPDQTVDANEIVTLDGSESLDTDGDSLTYLWTAPNGITLSDTTAVNPTFTAPEFNVNTNLTFTLVVNDGIADSAVDTIEITVNEKPNTEPIANAGPDQTVNANEEVTLDASGSNDPDGDALSYLWTAPDGISLSDITAVNPMFIAPEFNTNTDLTFTLVVNDGEMNSFADEVVITINQETNSIPVAEAGIDQTVDANELVTLDGSGSSDADGDALSYLWTAPDGITLSDATAINPTFIAPEFDTTTALAFSLVVNDGAVDSNADQVLITVTARPNTEPIANAGPDQTVNANEEVTLDASGSNDPDGDALSYLWTAPNGITLSDATAINPTFTAPEFNTNTALAFSLVVDDGTVNSNTDEIIINVSPSPPDCETLELQITTTDSSCPNANDGTIGILALGGTPPYAYTINEVVTSDFQYDVAPGNYTVSVTDANGCSQIADIVIDELPELSVTMVIDTEENIVELSLSGGETYFITLNDSNFETTETSITLPLSLVSNTILVTTDNECQGVFEDVILLESSGILYPNPASDGVFYLLNSITDSRPLTIELYTTSGRLVGNTSYDANEQIYEFDISNIAAGVYLVKITTLEEVLFDKIIVN